MATFAPYSAKRTAIACPMPELPPVTRTFFPSRPLRPEVRFSLRACSMPMLSRGPEARYTHGQQGAGHRPAR